MSVDQDDAYHKEEERQARRIYKYRVFVPWQTLRDALFPLMLKLDVESWLILE